MERAQIVTYITDSDPITGLTHSFYNYPARFSPKFARAMIEHFTMPGDIIMDPFMGGGTSIVEALATGRSAVGVDLNELSYFIAKVKTTVIPENDREIFIKQANHIIQTANIRKDLKEISYDPLYYGVNHLNTHNTWRLKQYIARLKHASASLNPQNRNLFKCAILKVSQWAFDNKDSIPTLAQFKFKLQESILEFANGLDELNFSISKFATEAPNIILLQRSIIGIERVRKIKEYCPPKLILTSPPYPGVHILYHRWQLKGRKETSAPYWIADLQDGHGESYYTFGNRTQRELTDYYVTQQRAFHSLVKIMGKETVIVQLIAFPSPDWQLPKYLRILKEVGLKEVDIMNTDSVDFNRIWRDVPHRKWYAQKNGNTGSSREVVLVHKLA